jgi:hypothetical protein
MKYKLLKLSMLNFILYSVITPVSAEAVLDVDKEATDQIENSTETLANGSYTDTDNTASKKIYAFKDSGGTALRTSTYDHLKVVKATYYPDSAVDLKKVELKISSWSINCEKKKFDHMKICYMNQGDLWVFLINGRYSVSVGSDHYPGSKGGMSFDNSSAIYGYEGELPKPLNIIERLKKGKITYTRYQEWPYEYNKDGEVSLKDFTKQFNEMLKQYKNL